MLNFPLFPEQASTFAEKVDILYYALVLLSGFASIGIFMAIVYMCVRFRHNPDAPRRSEPLESPILEITWTVIPAIIFLGVFFWAAMLFADYLNEPEGALEIEVVGKQWMWKIRHPDGMREVNELHVPVGRPVLLTMTSQDVLHDFYIPAFRVKQDVLPGRFTKLWFEATKPGEYHLFCAEYCGTEHSLMGGTVYVMEPADYVEWLRGGPSLSPRQAGALLFEQQGCVSCHGSVNTDRGPALAGLFGSTVTLATGETMLANEDYLRDAIMQPGRHVRAGFQALMPSYQNQLTEEDLLDLITYIKSLTAETN